MAQISICLERASLKSTAHDTLDDIAGRLDDQARDAGADIDFRQSNHEGHLIDWLHEAQAVGAKGCFAQCRRLHTHLDRHP